MIHRTWIKMCGITRAEDALACAHAGADALGFVFAESPRRIAPEAARTIFHLLPPSVLRVGVFVDETPAEIARVLETAEVDRVQIHGVEEPVLDDSAGTRVIRAFRARDESVLEQIEERAAPFFLLDAWRADAPGGTGETFDWDIARRARALGSLILAGGLRPENVGRAVREVRPFGVDVATGIEEGPGMKDHDRIRAFVEAVRAADRDLSREASAAG